MDEFSYYLLLSRIVCVFSRCFLVSSKIKLDRAAKKARGIAILSYSKYHAYY